MQTLSCAPAPMCRDEPCRVISSSGVLLVQGRQSRDGGAHLEGFLDGRDYAGATAFLTFQRREAGADSKTLEWLAYSHYHNWEHAQVTGTCRGT